MRIGCGAVGGVCKKKDYQRGNVSEKHSLTSQENQEIESKVSETGIGAQINNQKFLGNYYMPAFMQCTGQIQKFNSFHHSWQRISCIQS